MPSIPMPQFPDVKIDINELFPPDKWTAPTYSDFSMGDTFVSSTASNPITSIQNSNFSFIGQTPSIEFRTSSTSTAAHASSAERSSVSSSSLAALKGKHWTEMTDSEMRQVYGDYTRDITKPYNGTAEDLNKYLKGKGVLEGQGQAFIDAQKKYGISASVLVGIAMNESGGGKSKNAREKNNVGGVRIPGSTTFKTYSSVAECISDMARFLKSGYVNNNGRPLTKLYQINAKYCPSSDPTDRDNVNSFWARNVDRYTSEVETALV